MTKTNNQPIFDEEVQAFLFKLIANKIVERAVRDYIYSLRGASHSNFTRYTSMLIDCETFFTSEWFDFLCPEYNGYYLMKQIKKNVLGENMK